jgi:hypothetical protein
MADISSYLAAIMAAVYGEDVRGSIHDAIDIINKVGEVVLNTGTAVTGPTSSSTGFYDGSFYINTNTMELWKCIGTDSWQSQGTLKGADGADGNGITSIVKTSTVGLVDTYTITYDDGGTETYQVTNGQSGSKWYKGTAISGTGTSITGFPGVLNDFYLNSVDGYVYTCTKTGGAMPPDAAEWDYVMTLTGGGGTSVTVIDNLASTSSTDALSANQGRVLKGLVESKASDTQIFTEASTRANLVSGESLSTLFGKLMKWYTDLKSVAFSGSYTDLTNQPTIPTAANNGQLTIQQNGTNVQTFTADQSSNATANIITDDWAATASVSSGSVSFSGIDDTGNYGYEVFVEITASSTNKNPSAQISSISGTGTSSMSITYTTDADNGATCKLRRIK